MRSELCLAVVLGASHAFAQGTVEPEPAPPPAAPSPAAPAPAPGPSVRPSAARAPAPASAPTSAATPGPAAAPAAASAPAPGSAAAPAPAAAPGPAPARARADPDIRSAGWVAYTEREVYVALEVGTSSFGDARNIYNAGAGRGIVVGYGPLEVRVEDYDLEDRSGMLANVAHGDGIAAVLSAAIRFPLLGGDRAAVTGLLGVAGLVRPAMATYPDPVLVATDREIQHEAGLAALLGLGVQLEGVFYLDVRCYPTWWSGYEGTRLEYANGIATPVAVTSDTSPGGIPITLSAGVGLGF